MFSRRKRDHVKESCAQIWFFKHILRLWFSWTTQKVIWMPDIFESFWFEERKWKLILFWCCDEEEQQMPFSISRHLCVRENDWFQTRSLETWSFYYIFTEKKSSKPKFLVLQELNNWIPPVFCSCFLFFQDILTNNTIKLFSPSFVSCTGLSLSQL